MKVVFAVLATVVAALVPDAGAQSAAAKSPPTDSRAKSPPATLPHYGKVKWYQDAKGYGVITPNQGGPDIFVYFTAIRMPGFQTLKAGQKVSYDVLSGPKGDQATNVHVLP